MKCRKSTEPVDKSSKVVIVLRTDAVIKPFTVMIKLRAASVAWATVLRPFLNKYTANVTEKLKWLTIIGGCCIKR